jgi:hypothetical protein
MGHPIGEHFAGILVGNPVFPVTFVSPKSIYE